MSDLRKAAEMALEALEEQWEEHEAIDALRQALAQPKKEWVGLTDDDMEVLFLSEDGVCFARYIEAKLKEKNSCKL